MARWKIEPTWKKSLIERMYLKKDGNTVIIETGWRWGSFECETEDDNPPNIEAGDDLWSCGYDVEMIETFDGCWEEHDMDDCDEETQEWLENFFDEGNSWLDLEEHGWIQDEAEMIIDCDPEFELLEKTDGTKPIEEESGDSIACFSCDKPVSANELIEMSGQLICPHCNEGWVEPENRPEDKKWPF